MQYNDEKPLKPVTRPRLARTRFVGLEPTQQTTGPLPNTDHLGKDPAGDITDQPTSSITNKAQILATRDAARPRFPSFLRESNWNAPLENQSTAHLMQLSGMMRQVRAPGSSTAPLPVPASAEEDGYWPLGIQQVGPLPIRNLYGREPFGRTLPQAATLILPGNADQAQPLWRKVLDAPAFKASLGLLAGLALLFLVSRFIDFARAMQIAGTHLATLQGIALALLAGIVYLTSYSLRGVRWKLFLNPAGRVSTLKVIELYQVATFLNFLRPMRAGEAARSLALKRIASIPISKSLPTVAMDKVLDIVAALVLLLLFPFLGIRMNLQLWLVFGLACVVVAGLIIFIGLMVWKRPLAIGLLQKSLSRLPKSMGARLEGFVTGFVDSLFAAASRPVIFVPALLLTGLAVLCDGLFALLAFNVIGFPISFGTVLFGYAAYNLFSILPTPPGQFGSNEVFGLLVFGALLSLPGNDVLAMYIFSHLWIALIMAITGPACLKAPGLTITSALSARNERKKELADQAAL